MKKLLILVLMSVLIMSSVFPGYTAGAEENATSNDIESHTGNATVTPSQTADPKFRVAPTVILRPVNDVIDKSQDGIIELYMDNPSLNDVTLNVDARISVPSGIHVYGEGFGQAGAAGTVYGTFSVPPGKARTIYINVKGDKTGSFTVHFTGLYWPDDDKDDYNPISLTHPFVVNEPSPNPYSSKATGEKEEMPYTYIIGGLIIVIAIAIIVRRPPKTEVIIEE